MDFVFWIIAIVLIVGVVWWLLNRSNASKAKGGTQDRGDGGPAHGTSAVSAEAVGTAGIPAAAGFGKPAEPVAPTTADEAPERSSGAARQEPAAARDSAGAPGASAVPVADSAPAASPAPGHVADDWETRWSEASGSAPAPARPSAAEEHRSSGAPYLADAALPGAQMSPGDPHVHHPEYTGSHSPTLPGAETAAAEGADEAGHAAAPPESAADPEPIAPPAGPLAADQPYGAGSASSAPDGTGPEDFTVKADAGEMVYYEPGHPDYEQARAEVWFESAAHAEAAGFRAPRRKRL